MAISNVKVVPALGRIVVAWGPTRQYIPYHVSQLSQLLDGRIPQLLPAPVVAALAAVGYLALGGRYEDVAEMLPADLAPVLAASTDGTENSEPPPAVSNEDPGHPSTAETALGEVSQRPVRDEDEITGRWRGNRKPSKDPGLIALHGMEHPGGFQLRGFAELELLMDKPNQTFLNSLSGVGTMRALLWHPESESLQEVHCPLELSVALESGEVVNVTDDPKFENMFKEQQYAYNPSEQRDQD